MAPDVGEDSLDTWEDSDIPILSSKASFPVDEIVQPTISYGLVLVGRDLGEGIPEGWAITCPQGIKLPAAVVFGIT